MNYRFSTPIQIKMCDLDPFAHVNNGVQCNYFDYGRGQYFEKVFGEPIDWMTMDMVLVHVELDFRRPIKIHDEIVCETTIYEFGEKTVCHCVLCGFDRKTEKSIPIQERYKERITAFEEMR